jgi:ABC transporter substrate binding protein
MEEATGAPSSFADWDPRRLRASGRDGGGIVNRPPSSLTMLLSRHTRRREFITLIGGAAAAWPFVAQAQQGERVRRIGVLTAGAAPHDADMQVNNAAFLQTLQQLGWTVGRNVQIDYRWGMGSADSNRRYAAELVRSTPDVIVVAGWNALAELHRLTSTIPIVFTQVSDPVGAGFVTSLARPSTNISGFQNFELARGANGWVCSRRLRPTCVGQLCSSVRTQAPLWRCCTLPRRWDGHLMSR